MEISKERLEAALTITAEEKCEHEKELIVIRNIVGNLDRVCLLCLLENIDVSVLEKEKREYKTVYKNTDTGEVEELEQLTHNQDSELTIEFNENGIIEISKLEEGGGRSE